MASGRAQTRLTRLWQMPLLLASLGLFGYAAYLFIDPKPRITLAQRIEIIAALVKNGRAETALEQGNKLLENSKLKTEDQGRIHLLLAEAIEAAQKKKHISLAANYRRIIEQTQLGLEDGVAPSADIYRRLGESLEAVDHPIEAMQAYRQAMKLDKDASPTLQRKLIELELAQEDSTPAETSIERYLKTSKLANVDRAWALIVKARALIKRSQFAQAKPVLDEALRSDPAMVAQGVAHYWIGYCLWKLGQLDEAERMLRVAGEQLKVGHPLDAEAAYALGQIRLQKHDPKVAASFFQSILTSHPESHPAALARLRRGLCRIAMDDDDAGLTDLRDVVTELTTRKNRESYKQEAVAGLREATSALANKKNFQGALEALTDEQTLTPEPPAEFFARLGSVFERRADQVESTLASAENPAEKAKLKNQVEKLRIQAGDAYVSLSNGLTIADDRGQGDAMWKGVELYDRAGATLQSIAAMEKFIADRPGDPSTPDALLRLGRAYQATGQFDKAIKKLQWNQFRNPQSLAATKSGVPLAQAYIAKGPESYPKAERVLLAVIENNPIITPEAEEFRQALFELAQLYYRTGRYEDAISRLEETTARYPGDSRMAQLLFLMADSYRKSAGLLLAKIQAPSAQTATGAKPNAVELAAAATAKAEAIAARHDRLVKARKFFDGVVNIAREKPPARDIDKLYLKLAHFYRADCAYDLHEFEEAIRLYDGAALRYQDDPSAVAAYVQIVNAYCELGRLEDARTANERAKWLLRRMPAEAFDEGKSSMPKKYWDDWLRLTGESGIYARELRAGPLSDAR